MIGNANKAVVLVVDAFAMRCACITTLVNEWVSPLGKSARAATPENITAYAEEDHDVCLIILSVGGCSLHDIETQAILRALRENFPTIPCAVLSDHMESGEAVEAARNGYQAFISTGTPVDLAQRALAFVMCGGAYFPRETLLGTAALSGSHQRPLAPPGGGWVLTPRQRQVLERLRSGKSNKVIARELDMQESTVKVHVRQVMRKLGAANRTQAAIFAMAKDDASSKAGGLVVT